MPGCNVVVALTLEVHDATAACDDGKHDPAGELSLIWIHRIGRTVGADAVEIAEFFRTGKGKRYTGGQMAYHYIGTAERVEQALPLAEKGAHARRFANAHGIGFAQVGDFSLHPPRAEQWARAVALCADLVPLLSRPTSTTWAMIPWHLRAELPILGHGEVPSTFARTSGKDQPDGRYACPGRFWDMHDFRRDVRETLKQRAHAALVDSGHVFTRASLPT